jgi:hypothetical protein
VGPIVGPNVIGSWSESDIHGLDAGRYKFVLLRRVIYDEDDVSANRFVTEEYIATLPNSTFTIVKDDDGILSSDEEQNEKDESIGAALSIESDLLLTEESTSLAEMQEGPNLYCDVPMESTSLSQVQDEASLY